MSGFEIELPSSPDPLGEEGDDADNAPPTSARVPPSTTRRPPSTNRRLLQSNASSRFSALPGTSPRKRMFALDVGDEITPQTIFVTVEAGQDGNPIIPKGTVGSNVRRRLFGSPTPSQGSPQRRIRTTTTSVPLRGLTDDEGDPTPRQRRRSSGRPGTPATAATKTKTTSTRKKKGTPTPKAKSARKPRGTPTNPSSDIVRSETPADHAEQPTPAKRRGRPPKRKTIDPTTEPGDPNTLQTLPRKRGRKVRESLGPDQLALLSANNEDGEDLRADSQDILAEPDAPAPADDVPADQTVQEQDIWMATTSETPAVERQQSSERAGGVEMHEPRDEYVPPELDDQGFLPGESDDFAPMVDYDDRSDVGSEHQEGPQPHDAELEDQRPLPGESDELEPVMSRDWSSDRQRGFRAEPRELEDQGHLPGESDDIDVDIVEDKLASDPDLHAYEEQSHSADRTTGQTYRASALTGHENAPAGSDSREQMTNHKDRSRRVSLREERSSDRTGLGSDMTVDPDTFTMIGIEATSFRASRNSPQSEDPEMGDETSLFINRTLDSLRQEIAQSDDDEVDILVSRENTPPQAQVEKPVQANPSPRDKSQTPQSLARNSARYSSRSPGRTESEPASIARRVPRYYEQPPSQPLEDPVAERADSVVDDAMDDEDSFSDIPEDVLAAAGSQDDWHPSMGPTVEQLNWAASITKQTSVNGYGQLLGSLKRQSVDRLRSSHSTPSRSNVALTDPDATISQPSVSRSVQSRRASGQIPQRSSPPHPARSRADSNRLLTPDDTTSSSAGIQSPGADRGLPIDIERPAVVSDDIGSSPPQITSFPEDSEQLALPARRASDAHALQRPEIQVELVPERHTFAAVVQPGLQPAQPIGLRPTLSPVKRIGRTLQNILSDPPSPSARSSVLGSPFKGSGRNSSPLDGAAVDEALRNAAAPEDARQTHSSHSGPPPPEPGTQSTTRAWAMSFAPLSQIKHLVTQGAQLFTSPQVNSSQVLDDPFGPSSPTADKGAPRNTDNTGGSTFMDRIKEVSREGSVHSSRTSRRPVSSNGGTQRTVRTLSVTRNNGVSQSRSPASRSAAARSSKSGTPSHADVSTGYDGSYDQDADELAGEPSDEEIPNHKANPEVDGMLERSDPDDEPEDIVVQDEMQVDQDDETQRSDSPVGADAGEESEEEDIWAIEANRTASSPQPLAPENELSNLFRKSELSVDWGTSTNSQRGAPPGKSQGPGAGRSLLEHPPENLEEYSLVDIHSGTPTEPSAKKPAPEVQQPSKKVDLSDFFSSSPNFMERQRRAKEASLAKSAAQKVAAKTALKKASPEITTTTQAQRSGVASINPFASSSRPFGKLPTPAPGASQENTRESTTRTSSTPDHVEVARGAGKDLPRRRAQNDAALFETWSVSSSRPPTAHLPSSELNLAARPSTPPGPVESSYDSPELRPLPGRAASPSKSCLRSPLKPRTPGRVVEFTSSTASGVAPFQANAGLQNNANAAPAPKNIFASAPSFPGKENQPAPQSNNIDRSKQHSPMKTHIRHAQLVHQQQQNQQQQKTDSPLSQTRWTRRHWILLDELLQTHRRGALEFELRHASALMASPRRRSSSRLLGKQVTSQGESMVLEQWHLDVVDAFAKEAGGGWPEDGLAKRLFALIVGEERRRQGLVPRRR